MALFLTGPFAGMAPWDAASYFQTVKVVHYDLVSTDVELLVEADPNRVLLHFHLRDSFGAVDFAPVPDKDSELFAWMALNDPPTTGQSQPGVTITWGDHGPLVQSAWYAQGNIGDCIVTTRLSLTRWPDPKPLPPQQIKVPKCPPLKIA